MKKFRFGSVCSGIEAASAAWNPLGWETAFVSEIELFPNAVLAHHHPEVPNLGSLMAPDFIKKAKACGPIDLLVGGTPCQSFSVAGLRKGLTDARGNLTLRFVEVAHALKPKYIVWENVPGVLSDKTNAFGCLLAGLAGADAPFVSETGKWASAGVATGEKYSLAWRVIDAQFFGVPQRRRRVFLVGCLGDWTGPAKVLFERQGVLRDSAQSGEERQDAAASASSGAGEGGQRRRGATGRAPVVIDRAAFNAGENAQFAPRVEEDEVMSSLVARGPHAVGVPKVAGTLGANHGNIKAEDAWGNKLIMEPAVYSIMPMNSGKDYKARKVEVVQPLMAAGPGGGNQGGDVVLHPVAFGGNNTGGPINKAAGLNAKGGSGRSDFETETFLVHPAPIAFSSKDHGGDAGVVSPTLRAGGHAGSHPNAGVPPAVCYESPLLEGLL